MKLAHASWGAACAVAWRAHAYKAKCGPNEHGWGFLIRPLYPRLLRAPRCPVPLLSIYAGTPVPGTYITVYRLQSLYLAPSTRILMLLVVGKLVCGCGVVTAWELLLFALLYARLWMWHLLVLFGCGVRSAFFLSSVRPNGVPSGAWIRMKCCFLLFSH